jgi:excisionase family DNA binding protein
MRDDTTESGVDLLHAEPKRTRKRSLVDSAGQPGAETTALVFVAVDQLAIELGLNRKTLYNFIREGKLPGVRRICGRIRIHRPSVLEWFRRGQGAVPRSRSKP